MDAMQWLHNPLVGAEELEKTLSIDPALTANLLRFANSPYFGSRHQVATVRDAVVRLGVHMVSRMLTLSCASQFAELPIRGYELPPGKLWDSMLYTAVTTDLLAKSIRIKPPPFTFTAGLLSGIGKLILGTYLEVEPTPIRRLVEERTISFDEAERQLLGIDHAEVGAALLEHWALPPELVQAVRWTLDPNQHPDRKTAVDYVHVASFISMMAGAGVGVDGLNYDVCDSSMERLGLTQKIVDEVFAELPHAVQKLAHQSP